MADKLKLKCESCGRVFFNEKFMPLCFPCFNLKRFKEATKLPCNANSLGSSDSERAESKPTNCETRAAVNEVKTYGFEDEARLLESCVEGELNFVLGLAEQLRLAGFNVSGDAVLSVTHSAGVSVFIEKNKRGHIKEMRR